MESAHHQKQHFWVNSILFFLADMWLVCQQLVAQKQEEATPVRPFHAVFEPHHSVTPDRYGSEYGQNILYPKKEASSPR